MLKIEEVSENELKFIGEFSASQESIASDKLSEHEETLTIDMGELKYISSMGLGVLVKTNHRLNENGHSLRLKNLNSHIKDIFKFTRLDQVFDLID
ncbi:MAG: STAS domain-containing protein [Gracilimonas sp.]|uniref:STAS domain-containing protein n=1 Tax=Gracilimonas sediminicola TaxID=2952158 RepID=A0A9X2L4K7_9BACT|nr:MULTISPECIES: STAS domain-containing protein [Gracilimonas]MBO6585928.1 STAS domain-containing protein [Gracilimonas sp.]MBO6616925.1 STAS domain-containing protein [Gracilimonas sp.]MCP9292145.1 STAS domain-containing protein [Gracilimonas sediminicola]